MGRRFETWPDHVTVFLFPPVCEILYRYVPRVLGPGLQAAANSPAEQARQQQQQGPGRMGNEQSGEGQAVPETGLRLSTLCRYQQAESGVLRVCVCLCEKEMNKWFLFIWLLLHPSPTYILQCLFAVNRF